MNFSSLLPGASRPVAFDFANRHSDVVALQSDYIARLDFVSLHQYLCLAIDGTRFTGDFVSSPDHTPEGWGRASGKDGQFDSDGPPGVEAGGLNRTLKVGEASMQSAG